MSWWTRLRLSKSNLPAAVISTILCGVALVAIWSHPNDPAREMDRYGSGLSKAIAETSTGYLLHADRINLAVIANHLTAYPEVSGVVFFNVNNKIVQVAGSTESPARYTAGATLDDTLTGFVTLHIDREAFISPAYWSNWGLTLLALLLTPLATLGILQASSRGKRSLPIVSVPEPAPSAPQHVYLLIVNLHNQLALTRQAQQQALEDAVTMASEVSALYHGYPAEIPERGVALLLDGASVTAAQAVHASFLMQKLLKSYETEGSFRSLLTTTLCPGNPAELASLDIGELGEEADFETLLPIAALSREDTVLCSEDVKLGLGELAELAQPFQHPILEDLHPVTPVYVIEALPSHQAELVDGQAEVILGFSQATA